MLNRSWKNWGVLVLSLTLEEDFQLFTIEYDVSFGFVIIGLYYVEIYSLCTNFDEVFIINGC